MEMLAWRGMKWAIEKIINYKDEHRQGTVECVCEVVDVIVFRVVWPPTFVHSHSAPMHNKNNNIKLEEISAQLLTLRLLLTSDASVPCEKIIVILSMRKKKMRNCRRRRKPCCVMMVTTNLTVELEGVCGGGWCTCYNDKRRLSEQKGASLWNIIKFYEKLWRKKEKNNLFIQSGGNWKNTRIYDTESRTRSMYVGR